MPRLFQIAVLTVATVALAGCCRDTIREMASLKDMRPQAEPRRSAKAPVPRRTDTAKVQRDDDDASEGAAIETGSVSKPSCQGQHLAYQATKEYLKNFGPKPPDEPGERGPCDPDAQ